jgi:hypothetical protein
MRWEACNTFGKRRGASRVLAWNLRKTDNTEDTGVAGEILLRWIFMKWSCGQVLV